MTPATAETPVTDTVVVPLLLAFTILLEGCEKSTSPSISNGTIGSKLVKTLAPFFNLHNSSPDTEVVKSALTERVTTAGVLFLGVYPKFSANETMFLVSTALLI